MFYELYTPEGEQIGETPWQAYPRPQMKRESYVNLNGRWDFAVSSGGALPDTFDREILVPFCPESLLSGIHTHFPEGSYLFYRRGFTPPPYSAGDRVLLHIGAADQILDCYVNQTHIGTHIGGYEAITLDITDALARENTLILRVRDDLGDTSLPYGKQRVKRGGMWYTPVSGVWQSVWLERVPARHIRALDIRIEGACAVIRVDPPLSGVVAVEGEGEFPLVGGVARVAPKAPEFWSPEHPRLYPFAVTAEGDRVESYFALRTLEIKTVGGVPRMCLNGEPYFFNGLLDQGYYSDGLYTPAAPECYARDIRTAKRLGFNTLRKHIKVEPEEFYYQCDRLGMVVFQDMVNNGDYSYLRDTALPTLGAQTRGDRRLHRSEKARAQFLRSMEGEVRQLGNHPCIVLWTVFNEGWGQFDATACYRRLKALDGSRFINTVSGWFRGCETDVDSRHIYFGQWKQLRISDKPLILNEYGGICLAVEGHMFHPEKSYGYQTSTDPAEFRARFAALFREHILPAKEAGLCAAIYTQLSDVEDEVNGIVTYDRKVVKLDTIE